MKKVLVIIAVLLLVILAVGLAAGVYVFFPAIVQEETITDVDVPLFTEIPIDFTHQYDKEVYPFLGGAVIDIDSDGIQELFIGGGQGQDDALFFYDGRFTNGIAGTGLSSKDATYGVISMDVNNDTEQDLIIARNNGVFLYLNNKGTFTKQQIALNLESYSVPYSVAAGDINNDGFVDLYVSTFVDVAHFKSATFNDPEHGKQNILLVNNKDNTFTDMTKQAGVNIDQNTFISLFVDLNDDGLQDLVVATNTDTVHIFENTDDETFIEHPAPTANGFWMGLTAADLDNDGDQDLFFTNTGNIAPQQLLRGDLRDDQDLDVKWAMLRNNGQFTFTNLNKDLPDEFGWGAVFEDFNLDGRLDLLVSENYIKWFAHKFRKFPGRLLLQDASGRFVLATSQAGLVNKNFGQSPIVLDINNDGHPDVLFLNMDGPARVFLNKGTNNHWIKVKMPDTVAALGARVLVESPTMRLTKQVVAGQGYMTDQTNELFFGLAQNNDPVKVTVEWQSGKTEIRENVSVDSVVTI